MNFKNQYAIYQTDVESAIQKLLPPKTTEPPVLHEAMHYALDAGGKRLRPILVLAAASLYPSKIDPIPAATAIEFLHTYSLVHDDLPCMDDSNLRRGVPATHIKFGESMGVLTGDALLTEAFLLIASAYQNESSIAAKLSLTLTTAASSKELIGGQVVDTLSEDKKISKETLNFIHLNKTAALIKAALKMGLIVSDAPSSAYPIIETVGTDIGLAFQIVDDILDVTSDAETMGKTVGADCSNKKNTYVKAYGIEESRQKVKALTLNALNALGDLEEASNVDFLRNLIQQLEHRIN